MPVCPERNAVLASAVVWLIAPGCASPSHTMPRINSMAVTISLLSSAALNFPGWVATK